jgi:hypothetical protein
LSNVFQAQSKSNPLPMPSDPAPHLDEVMQFGDFELRPAERALLVRGAPVALGSGAF